jgi:opacity protein-like surface antigen
LRPFGTCAHPSFWGKLTNNEQNMFLKFELGLISKLFKETKGMLRKTVLFGSLLAALGTTSATSAHSSFYKSGFLAGAQVGVASGKGTFNAAFNPFIGAIDSQSGSARKTGPIFGLLAGYRHVFNHDWMIGLILEGNVLGSSELSKQLSHFNNTTPIIQKVKKTYNVIPTVTIGNIFCGRWHASLGLGLAIARFKQNVVSAVPGVPGSVSGSQTKVGFVPSIGVEYAANQNVSLFGNVSYEVYGKVSKTIAQNALFGVRNTYTSSIKPKYLTLKVGAVYRF